VCLTEVEPLLGSSSSCYCCVHRSEKVKMQKKSQTCTDMVQGDTTLTCIILASYIANVVMIKTE